MDPESVAFQPRDDLWRMQNEMLRVQQSQAELAERVARLENKQDNDLRLKNVWGTSSPFPSVLGGTPQQVPLQQPTAEHFNSFDDQSNLIGNLQLDDVEEPRRLGATSRANSVRFDETANHGHWAHASRSSLDLIPRTGSGLSGFAMSERSYSHKSDGRQSSAGQSIHSTASGRANSLTGLGPNIPADPPGLAPGLFILGSVPAIIRCWLDTDFKHNTLLYAAVCSGSRESSLDINVAKRLGFDDDIATSVDGTRKLKISLYLPEAVPVSVTARSDSPATLPSIVVDFTIIEEYDPTVNDKAVQIILGSNTLRTHNADILFSTNQVTLYDEDRTKLRIPLVRPEDERTFQTLSTTIKARQHIESEKAIDTRPQSERSSAVAREFPSALDNPYTAVSEGNGFGVPNASASGASVGRRNLEGRPQLGLSISSRGEGREAQNCSPTTATSRSGPSPAIWSNWRRDSNELPKASTLDWANVGKTTTTSTNYKARDTGIKVLKTTKSMSRAPSSSTITSTGQSRFFDDGKKREGEESSPGTGQMERIVSGEKSRENGPAAAKARTTNPVGGASAFAWLN